MGHASSKSGSSTIWNRRSWNRKLNAQRQRDECGHVWEWDPKDRLMRCYKCGGARLPTDADKLQPRMENTDTDF